MHARDGTDLAMGQAESEPAFGTFLLGEHGESQGLLHFPVLKEPVQLIPVCDGACLSHPDLTFNGTVERADFVVGNGKPYTGIQSNKVATCGGENLAGLTRGTDQRGEVL